MIILRLNYDVVIFINKAIFFTLLYFGPFMLQVADVIEFIRRDDIFVINNAVYSYLLTPALLA